MVTINEGIRYFLFLSSYPQVLAIIPNGDSASEIFTLPGHPHWNQTRIPRRDHEHNHKPVCKIRKLIQASIRFHYYHTKDK